MAKAKFNLMDTLNKVSRDQVATAADVSEDMFKPQMISVHNLVPSAGNFYDTADVLDLKRSIELFGGVKQNLIVKPAPDGKYEIISGHRRHKACLELVEEGVARFEFVPCIVERGKDPLIESLLLIMTNSTARVLTDHEKCRQAEELKTLLGQLKERENLPGRVREMVAAAMNVSESQVARYDAINAKLGAEAKAAFDDGTVPVSVAYEVSKKPQEEQADAVDKYIKDKVLPPTPKTDAPAPSKADTPATSPPPKLVYVCSAYRGKPPYSPAQRGMNLKKAIAFGRLIVKEGHMPIAPHVILADFLNDDNDEERAQGLRFAHALIARCDEVRVFGDYVTEGMAADIGEAKRLGKLVIFQK